MPVYGLPVLRAAVLVCALVFLVFIVNSRTWVDKQLSSRNHQTTLEESLSVFIDLQRVDKNIPGISISVINGQETIFEEGFGFSDKSLQVDATPYTVYHGGTLAQIFTTIAILQRVELEYIDLDKPVSMYLPGFSPNSTFAPLTLRHILSHQSGLLKEPPVGHSLDPNPTTLKESVQSFYESPVVYPPEIYSKYSNAGFGAAGLILEESLEKPFAQYMRAILDRMDLMRTSFSPRLDLKSKLAQGFTTNFEGHLTPTSVYEIGNIPATHLYTTVNDLGTFLKVIFANGESNNGVILNATSLEQMWTAQFDSTALIPFPNGLGFAVSKLDNEPVASLSSSSQGYTAYVAFFPELKAGVAILANIANAQSPLEQIGRYALQLLKSEFYEIPPSPAPRTYPIDSTQLSRAIGFYEDEESLYISTLDNIPYLYKDGNRYRLRKKGDSLIVDDFHAYGTILLSDGLSIELDRKLYVKKDPLTSLAQTDQYDSLMGVYGLKDHPVALVSSHNKLYLVEEWLSAYPLEEVEQDSFSLPAFGLYGGETVSIIRNEHGEPSQLLFANMLLDRLPKQDYSFTLTELPLGPSFAPLRATGPAPLPDSSLLAPQLVDLTMVDPLLNMEFLFASDNNIFGTRLYNEARVLLQKPVAEAIFRIQRRLRTMGLGLMIYDAYRPWRTTQAIKNNLPDSLSIYFIDEEVGYCQNRGTSVSVGLYSLRSGELVSMPTPYGTFASETLSDYPFVEAELRENREFLRHIMEAQGFRASKYKWWYYSHDTCKSYPIMDVLHEDVNQSEVLDRAPITVIR